MNRITLSLLRMFMFVGLVFVLLGGWASCTPESEVDCNHEAVDLGLSVKWSSCNVGADSPEDYGYYYRWGEIKEFNINSGDYKYFQPIDLGESQYYGPECWKNIVPKISGTSYDVAHVRWGRGWRMPTESEVCELCEMCSWQWTVINGVNGYKIIGPNGNFIFLPAVGFKIIYEEENIRYCGEFCCYWAGTLFDENNPINHDFSNLFFAGANANPVSIYYPLTGFSIRPVKE